mgnify:CR=1 FL=1
MNKYAKMTIAMCFAVLAATAAAAHEKVPIKEVTSLLLHRGKMTTGRRSAPVPQINCLSNCNHSPDTIFCSNVGFDGEDVVWECKSDPAGAAFRNLNVQCEGYDYPDDPYILKGSCGIEFSMASATESRPKYHSDDSHESNPLGSLLFLLFLMAVISCIMDDGGGGSSSRYSSPSYYSPRYRSSSSDFWTGAATGYAVGRSGSRGSSTWGSSGNSTWGGGGGSRTVGSSYASTSRR